MWSAALAYLRFYMYTSRLHLCCSKIIVWGCEG
jgi:hypothetical protein